MKKLAWDFLLFGVPLMLVTGIVVGERSYEHGYKVGSATQAVLVEQSKPVYDTDQVCTQWLFEANMKDVRKRMCGR